VAGRRATSPGDTLSCGNGGSEPCACSGRRNCAPLIPDVTRNLDVTDAELRGITDLRATAECEGVVHRVLVVELGSAQGDPIFTEPDQRSSP
jgi:hypothetical protein